METVTVEVGGVLALLPPDGAPCDEPAELPALLGPDGPAGAEELIRRLRELGFTGEALTVCYEPVTGSHVGPGTVAFFFPGIHR